MGKKYIVKLDDNKLAYTAIIIDGVPYIKPLQLLPYTEPDIEQIRKEAYEDGYKTAKVQCNIQAEKDLREVGERHYQKGLSDAWEAAWKVVALSTVDRRNVFGSEYMYSILEKHTASEAIEKLKAYEQEQNVQVGDEVTPRETEYDDMIVTRLWKDDYDSDCIDAIGFDGRIGSFLVSRVSKTGKHYEIAAILEKMKGKE